jgi:hypothetical protein
MQHVKRATVQGVGGRGVSREAFPLKVQLSGTHAFHVSC